MRILALGLIVTALVRQVGRHSLAGGDEAGARHRLASDGCRVVRGLVLVPAVDEMIDRLRVVRAESLHLAVEFYGLTRDLAIRRDEVAVERVVDGVNPASVVGSEAHFPEERYPVVVGQLSAFDSR